MKKIIFCLLFINACLKVNGQTIETSLTYVVNEPAKKTYTTPVLIMLHGYGSNETDLFDIAKAIDPRFITFSLRAPVTISEGAYCWYILNRTEGQPATYDYKEAKGSASKILTFISNACKTYKVDSTQVFVMGFSQGAIMSYELALSAPKKIKGILALSGRMMPESKIIKTDWSKVAKVNYFLAHGNSDNIIKSKESDNVDEFLKSKGVKNLTYRKYEMPHSICGAELNDIKAWLLEQIKQDKKIIPKK